MNHGGALVNLSFRRRSRISDFGVQRSEVVVKAVTLDEGRIGAVVEAVSQPQAIPGAFALSQNVPNPFNLTTTIHFRIAEDAYVTLRIYNILGQEVRTLMDKPVEAGHQTVLWNGRDNSGDEVGTGVYVYQLIAGDFVGMKKAVLLK